MNIKIFILIIIITNIETIKTIVLQKVTEFVK